MKIVVTTYPFGDPNPKPRQQLEGLNVSYNTIGREYEPEELRQVLIDEQPDIIIAGVEKYCGEFLDLVPNLKLISRVGVGLDSVPLEECEKRGIMVCYTPTAPSNAVAELTIAQMLNALRRVRYVDNTLRDGGWDRFIGREIRSCDVGIIGMGRIGSLVAQKLSGLKPRRIFVNDIIQEKCHGVERCEYETKLQILCHCDIVTIHIPYNERNHHFIQWSDLQLMKKDAVIINLSRGNIIDEDALLKWLGKNPDAFGVLDCYSKEPYVGPLKHVGNCALTPHLGSCTKKSRVDMEVGATEEAMNFLHGREFNNRVI